MPQPPSEPRDSSLADFKLQVMAATDIVEVIGRTVALKKRGKDFLGLCPFHSEKTPSFHVNPARQFYYCFGCKAAGDAINFVKQRDRVEFMDALKTLAQEAGVPIPQFGRGRNENNSDTQVVLEANSHAAMFFEGLLADPARGRAAREYLAGRGISEETSKRFRIGLAPDGWDHLLKGGVGRKFTPQQLFLAGLVKQREGGGGYYDTFRNRLMFPIRDPNGRVIAFGGRVMPGSDDKAKYLNSPETPVFSKGRSVYGLDLARQRIVETQTAVVVEGYTDVVMAHQFGATNTVSILGTAMTEQHVSMLRRFAERIVLLFDADAAGETAVDRAVSLFLTQPVEIAIATLGEDLDPDEYLLKHGLEAWDRLIAKAPEALAYKWRQLVRHFSGEDADGRSGPSLTGQQNALENYLGLIAQARTAGPVDPIRWGLAVTQIAKLTGLPVEQLQRRLAAGGNANRPARGGGAGPAVAGAPAGQSGPAVRAPQPSAYTRKGPILSARDRAERWILGVLLLEPGRWQRLTAEVHPEDFHDARHRRFAEVYWSYQEDEGEPQFSEFLAHLDAVEQRESGSPSADDRPGGSSVPGLKELAIEMSAEVETLAETHGDLGATLSEALIHLRRNREHAENQKLIATLRRSVEESLGGDQEAELLRRLQEQVRSKSSGSTFGKPPR